MRDRRKKTPAAAAAPTPMNDRPQTIFAPRLRSRACVVASRGGAVRRLGGAAAELIATGGGGASLGRSASTGVSGPTARNGGCESTRRANGDAVLVDLGHAECAGRRGGGSVARAGRDGGGRRVVESAASGSLRDGKARVGLAARKPGRRARGIVLSSDGSATARMSASSSTLGSLRFIPIQTPVAWAKERSTWFGALEPPCRAESHLVGNQVCQSVECAKLH